MTMTLEELHAGDKCGYCGYADGINTWWIDSPEDMDMDCDCEEHISCKNCGVPL